MLLLMAVINKLLLLVKAPLGDIQGEPGGAPRAALLYVLITVLGEFGSSRSFDIDL